MTQFLATTSPTLETATPTDFATIAVIKNAKHYRLADKQLLAAWKAYHKLHATLRYICSDCNLHIK